MMLLQHVVRSDHSRQNLAARYHHDRGVQVVLSWFGVEPRWHLAGSVHPCSTFFLVTMTDGAQTMVHSISRTNCDLQSNLWVTIVAASWLTHFSGTDAIKFDRKPSLGETQRSPPPMWRLLNLARGISVQLLRKLWWWRR